VSADVDSTAEEADVLVKCIGQQGWRSVVLVTSDYHSRRAGMIWRRTMREQRVGFLMAVHAVADPEFHPAGWWRERRSAKTWFMECTKLVWTLVGR